MSTLKVYIDFKSPAAYLALQPTLTLAATTGSVIQWHALPAKQAEMPAEASNEDVSARHRRVRAEARKRMHLHYAGVQNLPMHYRDIPGNTDFALAALAELDKLQDEFVGAAFNAYWAQNQDLNKPDVVAGLLEAIGAPMPACEDVDAVLASCHAQALAQGVIDTPGYVIEDQVFIGREHLPWIKEILSRKTPC